MDNLPTYGHKGLLYSRVAESIRKYISEQNLQTGDKLPSERMLCEILGASRSSIREALRQMENQGVITVEPGRGSFVAKRENASILIQYVKENTLQQLEVKSVLESQVIRHAVTNATAQQLEELDFIARYMNEIGSRGIYPRDQDLKFHDILSSCTPNVVLRSMLRQMAKSLMNFWDELENWRYMKEFGATMCDTVPFHYDIVKALYERDEQKALAAYKSIYDLDVIMYNRMNTMG